MTADHAPSDEVESVALWLGPPDRPVFAWLDLPDDDFVAGIAVICPTMGLEAAYSARALRDLGRRLAASRWGALRLDFAGTGDSAGTWTDPGLVAEWQHEVRGAIEFARARGAPRVAVVGLRIGATLAAAELAGGGGVDDLVLWDPCATGPRFLREQRALWAFLRDQATEWGTLREGEVWGSGGESTDGSFEAPGALFSAETVSDLESLAIAGGDRSLASRELLLARRGRKLHRVLAERLTLPHVESERIAGQDVLLDVDAITPDATLERIVQWVTEPRGPLVRFGRPAHRTAVTLRSEGRPSVRERPLDMGPAHLFGMLSEPEGQVEPAAPTIVFLNAGRIGHQGPARLWVELSRSWAAEGLRCVRVDLSGIGDSPTRPGRTELVEFPADALEDLDDIRRALSAEGATELVLVGLCSGGYHAIESALAAPVASVCVVNPAITYYRGVQHPERRFEPNVDSSGLSDREAWGSTRPIVSTVLSRLAPVRDAVRRVPGSWWVLKRWFVTASPGRMFERLTRSGVDVLVVSGSVEEHALYEGERRRIGALIRTGGLSVETIPNLEHTLLERTGRDRVSALLQAHVTCVVGAGGSRPAGRGAMSLRP